MTTTKIETRHGVMAVDDSATDGFPVVFIHGNSASRSIFRHQVDADWAGDYRMITLDLLGHGDSEDASDPEAAYTQNGYADAVVDVLTELGVERAVVVGWSLGGHIALELIAKFPGSPESSSPVRRRQIPRRSATPSMPATDCPSAAPRSSPRKKPNSTHE